MVCNINYETHFDKTKKLLFKYCNFDITAGSDTTQYTMRWIILFLANYTDIQIKMRKEISNTIGDRMPVHEDKSQLHYVNAFITECLRFRGVAPVSVPHTTKCDAKFGIQLYFIFSILITL